MFNQLTEQDIAEMEQEIEHRKLVVRPRLLEDVKEARAHGDLSENFEYHAAKREQGKLLSRISYKQKILENARVIDASVLGNDTVGLLRKVEMTNLGNNAKMTYTIVNPHEANLREGKISIKSPIAEALLGKKTGEIVEAKVPSGILKLRIDNITL